MSAVGKYLRLLEGGHLAFWCPGCDEPHTLNVSGEGRPAWTYNGNQNRPSFTPSVLVRSGHYAGHFKEDDECWCTYDALQIAAGKPVSGFKCGICHTYVTDGRIQFLGDCTHALTGQTVDLPEFP